MTTMTRCWILCFAAVLSLVPVLAQSSGGGKEVSIEKRIVRADSSKYHRLKAVHDGAGEMDFRVMLGADAIEPNLIFFHRGVILPHSGIGQHFHNKCEEMFVILDGEAQFTVDGRTSLIKGPAGVPDRMGHAHGIYNPTDKPLQWLNINVGLNKNYDTFNLGDSLEHQNLDAVPQFINFRLDNSLLRAVPAMDHGRGTVQYRRVLQPTVFFTTWSYFDDLVLPPGPSVGTRALPDIAEVYYVVSGNGTVQIGDEKSSIHSGDVFPIQLGTSRSIENAAAEPMELLVVGVARDMAAKESLMAHPQNLR